MPVTETTSPVARDTDEPDDAAPDRTPDPQVLLLADDLRAALRGVVVLMRTLDHGDLTAMQTTALQSLLDGPKPLRHIAAHTGITAPSASVMVKRLQEAGFVTRDPDPDDARAVAISITETGRAALAAANERRSRMLVDRLTRLSPDDRQLLADAIPLLADITRI